MALRPPGPESASGRGGRHRAVILTVIVLGGVLATTGVGAAVIAGGGVAAPGVGSGVDGQIARCTTIDEPGRYELVADLEAPAGPCLHVRANDVILDGNGHTVRGTAADAGIGVLVFNGSVGGSPAFDSAGAPLRNVTVRDMASRNWSTGLQVGEDLDVDGPTATVRNVTVAGNHAGLLAFGSEDVVLRSVTARDNAGTGVELWGLRDATVTDLRTTGNGDDGLHLRETRHSTLRSVATTDNGRAGILFGITTGNNAITDVRVARNDGPGLAFRDSYDNAVRNATIVDNAGAGILSDPAGGDVVGDSTVGGNAVAYRKRYYDGTYYGVIADDLTLENGAVASFGANVSAMGVPESAPATPADATVVGPPTNLTVAPDATGHAEITAPYDAGAVAGDESVALWHYDGTWRRLDSDVARSADTVSANVSETGVVVPLATPAAGEGNESATFVVHSTGDGTEFAYGFVVDGTIETAQGNVSADAEEHVEVREDGRMVALGSTGDGYGDAFTVTGEIDSFDYFPKDGDVRLTLDGRDVTEELNCTETVVVGERA